MKNEMIEEFEKEALESFNNGKPTIVKKAKKVLEDAEQVQLVITEKSLLANGTAISLLACVCTLVEKMNREGLPKDVIMAAMDSATSGKSDKEQLQELFEKLIDRL